MNNIYANIEEEDVKNNLGFVFYSSKKYGKKKEEQKEIFKPTYDEIYNNYKIKIKQNLVISKDEAENNNGILNYVITVPFNWTKVESSNDGQPLYLRGLTTQGSINLNLLNSGNSKLIGYRFYNKASTKQTTFNLFFVLYPKVGKSFSNLKLNFYLPNSQNLIYTLPLDTIKNGSNTINFNWSNILSERELYIVKISYQDCDNNTVNIKENYWFLTTELFNSCFNSGNPKYIANYCNPVGNEQNIINELTTVKIKDKNKNNINITSSERFYTEGNFINTNSSIKFSQIKEDTLKINSEGLELEIENEDLYPSYISLKNNNSKINSYFNDRDIEEILKRVCSEYNIPENCLTIQNTNDGIVIKAKEYINGLGKRATGIRNLFVKMSEALPYLMNATRNITGGKPYYGIFLDLDHAAGEDDHQLALIEESYDENGGCWFGFNNSDFEIGEIPLNITPNNENLETKCRILGDYNHGYHNYGIDNNTHSNAVTYDGKTDFHIPHNILNRVFNEFEFLKDSKFSCTWLFSNNQNNRHYYKTGINSSESSNGYSAQDNTIIWWRSIDSNNNVYWRASNQIINKSSLNNPSTLVNLLFGNDFYFCFFKEAEGSDLNLYIPDINNTSNTKFIFNDDIKIENIPIRIQIVDARINNDNSNILKFTCTSDNDEYLYTHKINTDKFTLEQNLQSSVNIEKIDTSGRSVDNQANELNINYLYYEDDKGQLQKVKGLPFIVTENTFSTSNGNICRYLYCNEDYCNDTNVNDKITISRIPNSTASIAYNEDNSEQLRIYFHNVPLIPKIKKTNGTT